MAVRILARYTRGFRAVFITNASLSAAATLVSVLMIRHKELTRGDEEGLRMDDCAQEKAAREEDRDPEKAVTSSSRAEDAPMGILRSQSLREGSSDERGS
ncbi:hypothetical protein SCP_0305860 [Sparassis crispa]|uniref:Uncharacterized protein n=1 Tax=Sparassis crispa TaxID=139825 RepID=A0A401GFA1_9APHY|nr:hypothetical protein SCP_0305860 [Sparassis crispa]GBE80866.1 hypothetical protein SCP_0305860 [Sparassis crispa]